MSALRKTPAVYLLVSAAGIGLAGCNRQEVQDLFDKGVEQAKKVQEKVTKEAGGVSDLVQQQLDLAGNLQLSLSPPLNRDACYVKFVPAVGGRPSVLQLQSYRAADQEKFPSIFLQAHVTAESLTELVGQSVPAQLFVQVQQDGPVWFADSDHPVELTITAIDENFLTAELISGALQSTDDAAAASVTGRFTGVLP